MTIAFITPVFRRAGMLRTIADAAMRTSGMGHARAMRGRSHSQRLHLRPPVSHGMPPDGYSSAVEIRPEPILDRQARSRRGAFPGPSATIKNPPAARRDPPIHRALRRWICRSGFRDAQRQVVLAGESFARRLPREARWWGSVSDLVGVRAANQADSGSTSCLPRASSATAKSYLD